MTKGQKDNRTPHLLQRGADKADAAAALQILEQEHAQRAREAAGAVAREEAFQLAVQLRHGLEVRLAVSGRLLQRRTTTERQTTQPGAGGTSPQHSTQSGKQETGLEVSNSCNCMAREATTRTATMLKNAPWSP